MVRAGVTPVARVKEVAADLPVTPKVLLNGSYSENGVEYYMPDPSLSWLPAATPPAGFPAGFNLLGEDQYRLPWPAQIAIPGQALVVMVTSNQDLAGRMPEKFVPYTP